MILRQEPLDARESPHGAQEAAATLPSSSRSRFLKRGSIQTGSSMPSRRTSEQQIEVEGAPSLTLGADGERLEQHGAQSCSVGSRAADLRVDLGEPSVERRERLVNQVDRSQG